MRPLPLVVCVVLSLLRLPASQNSLARQGATEGKSGAQTSFAALKNLTGSWTGTVKTDPANPDIEGPIQITLRVASRGNLLMHEIASGGFPEPTTIYLEGDRLMLVHYCDAGNRPRLMARPSSDDKTIQFEFVDISGSSSPLYLHDLTVTMIDADRHTEDLTFMMAGDRRLQAHFDLKRTR